MARSNVLVLGGTGAIGSFVVSNLALIGYNVTVTSRQYRQSSPNVEYLCGNAHDSEFIEKCLGMKKWNAVVDFMNYQTSEFKDKYKLFLNSTQQYIFISSSRVYADSSKPLVETSPRLLDVVKDNSFLKTDDYALSKARCENLLISSGALNWTIIRPYMSYYKYRLDLGHYPKELWLYRVIHGRSILFPKDVASCKTTLTYGDDVGRGIISIIGQKKALGNIYNMASPKSYTWGEILNVYKQNLQNRGYRFQCKYVEKAENDREFIYKYDRTFNRVFNDTSIKSFIDTAMFEDALIGISKSINEFLDNPTWKAIDWRKHAHWDKLMHETTPLSEIKGIKDRILYMAFRYLLPYNLLYNTWISIKSYKL